MRNRVELRRQLLNLELSCINDASLCVHLNHKWKFLVNINDFFFRKGIILSQNGKGCSCVYMRMLPWDIDNAQILLRLWCRCFRNSWKFLSDECVVICELIFMFLFWFSMDVQNLNEIKGSGDYLHVMSYLHGSCGVQKLWNDENSSYKFQDFCEFHSQPRNLRRRVQKGLKTPLHHFQTAPFKTSWNSISSSLSCLVNTRPRFLTNISIPITVVFKLIQHKRKKTVNSFPSLFADDDSLFRLLRSFYF